MKFYAGLKGKLDDSFEAEFTQMLQDLGIPHKRHEFPTNLSGGWQIIFIFYFFAFEVCFFFF